MKRKTTKALWAQAYPEAEYWPLKRDQYSKDVTSSGESTPTASNTPSQFTYDILKACMRQKLFYYQVGKVYYWYSIVEIRVIYFVVFLSKVNSFKFQVSLPHYKDESFLENSIVRYRMYLYLKLKYPDKFLVPCYDIDVVWHTHQVRIFLENNTNPIITLVKSITNYIVKLMLP